MVALVLCSLLLPLSLSFETPLASLEIIAPNPPPSGGLRNRALFTIPVSIGTPYQTIPLIVDTSRPSTVVYDSKCTTCTGENRFNASNSSSKESDGMQENMTDYKFVRVRDVFDLSGNGSFPVQNHYFETVVDRSNAWLFADGFFGLSPETAILDRMHCSEYIDKRAFAVFFTGDGSSNVSRSGLDPVISWGSWNLSKYSTSAKEDFDYVPVESETEWKIRVDSVKFGDLELAGKNSYAFLRTHDARILVPNFVYKSEIYRVLRDDFGIYDRNLPCAMFDTDMPDIVVTIGEVEITMPKEVYVYNSTYNCSYEIAHNASEEVFVFGVPFFQSAYVLFDLYNHRVGIAPSRNVEGRTRVNKLWIVIAAAIIVIVVAGVTAGVMYCTKKKRVMAVYDDTTEQLISNRNDYQFPG